MKFNFKKWVVESKHGISSPHYGSLNEQNAENSGGYTPDSFGQAACPQDSTLSQEMSSFHCNPSYVRTSGAQTSMWFENTTPNYLVQDVYGIAAQGGYNFEMYNSLFMYASVCCTGSFGGPDTDVNDEESDTYTTLEPNTNISGSIAILNSQGPVCCDPDAANYGANENGFQPMYGNINPTDTFLMMQGSLNPEPGSGLDNMINGNYICDNSICTGAATPGDAPVDAIPTIPDKGFKQPTSKKISKDPNRKDTRLQEVKYRIKNILKKLKK